jgi:peptidoglycan/LPS O-acetylase OafA/YrhL
VKKPLIASLTGLRAFAALWVLALHGVGTVAVLFPGATLDAISTLTQPGFLGVDVFFVLSGFIISYNYASVFDGGFSLPGWARFLQARLARIYPVHFVLLAALAGAVLGLGFGQGGEIELHRWSATGLIECLLLVHAWVGHWDVWNPVSWSISSEWLAYLFFPALSAAALLLVQRLPVRAVWVIVPLIVTAPAWPNTFEFARLGTAPMLILQIGCDFLGGCVTFRLCQQGRRLRPLDARPGVVLLLLVACAAAFLQAGIAARWAVALVPFILIGLASGSGIATRVFAHPVAVYLGRISYSLYMTHYLWIWVAQTVLPMDGLVALSAPGRLAGALIYLLPTLPIAAITYHVIEEPARRALTKAPSGRLRARPATVASETGIHP